MDRHLQENVFNIGLCVFDLDIEITVVGKDAGVNQLILWFIFAAPPVFFDEPRVGKSGLRIFVEHPHVRMGRGTVEVIIELLDVLTVVAFRVGQSEQPLLEDRIATVPQRQAQTKQQLIVAKAADPIFAPAIGPTARMIMWEIVPRRAVFAIILAHGSPLALAQIGAPAPPMLAVADFFKAPTLGRVGQDAVQFRVF